MNTDKIQDIIRVFEESGLHKMELEVDDMKIKMEKGAAADSRGTSMETAVAEAKTSVAVSYTHLDVYKRQILDTQERIIGYYRLSVFVLYMAV